MSLEEFIKEYNHAPFTPIELAALIIKHIPEEEEVELTEAADDFLHSEERFNAFLARIGYEFG